MCESAAFVVTDGTETKIMDNVILVRPEGERLLLADLFGERKELRARIVNVDFLKHRILLEEIAAP